MSITPDPVLRQYGAGAEVYKTTPQGDLEIQLQFPEGWTAEDRRPAVIFFFGGGWRGGNVRQFVRQATYLTNRGLAAARADYRVKSRQGTTPLEAVADGKSAVRWLRAHAAALGIDPDRIVGSGGSAGGHLAACAGIIDGRDEPGEDLSVSSRPNLLVLFNPVVDFSALDDAGERLGVGADGDVLAREISPAHHLRADSPPTVLFFGDEDGRFYPPARAAELGMRADLHVAAGQKHGFFNNAPWVEATMKVMDDFLVEMGYLKGDARIDVPEGVELTLERPAG